MTESRRSFLKRASLLAGTTALTNMLPASIQRALAINALPGTTYLDAEHIVFLMQENRSFDHCYGTLKGVRGFNDPRAIHLPNGLPVWLQTNKQGETFPPFRLDIKNTKATWMGSLPHGWDDMVEARNNGKMDTWLEAKKAGNKTYQHMPLTMGYYDRQDIPFYYALADAFTVCDQHFCSSLTGTSANRSYFWSASIREEPRNPQSVAHVNNDQINYQNVGWKTFPERLQEAGIPWKVYQNELSLPVGFEGEEEDWLANFTDNNLEFSKQYHVRFHPAHRAFMESELKRLTALLERSDLTKKGLKETQEKIAVLEQDIALYSKANFDELSTLEKEIHTRAFVTNTADPHYHELETIAVDNKEIKVPKGDIFDQFRKDVNSNQLPTVSWLVAPCNFSDHPGAPWYGAWYVSEALDILTKNPEVWKKTIFILTYDENDGYFDHIPPFVPPHSDRKEDGSLADGLTTADEFVDGKDAIGLGFRVPLVVASPWSKGGYVNSEVFDHTSPLQFLEHFIERKTGKKVIEENISAWRRTVCGNLSSVFHPNNDEKVVNSLAIDRDQYIEGIFSAKEKMLPGNFNKVASGTLDKMAKNQDWHAVLPKQEPGVKPACPIPYNLTLDALLDKKSQQINFHFLCKGDLPKTKSIGAPFQLYAISPFGNEKEVGHNWNFAARENEPLSYQLPLKAFNQTNYHFRAYAPNGFYREFKGNANDPEMLVEMSASKDKTKLTFRFENRSAKELSLTITDRSYKQGSKTLHLPTGAKEVFMELKSTSGWYDYSVQVDGFVHYEQRFAGHIETGAVSITDPYMGGII